jgi:hypothetical protein
MTQVKVRADSSILKRASRCEIGRAYRNYTSKCEKEGAYGVQRLWVIGYEYDNAPDDFPSHYDRTLSRRYFHALFSMGSGCLYTNCLVVGVHDSGELWAMPYWVK